MPQDEIDGQHRLYALETRMASQEGRMERVLATLEGHNATLSTLIVKIDGLLTERTKVGVMEARLNSVDVDLRNLAVEMRGHHQKLSEEVRTLTTYVEQGRGASRVGNWSLNTVFQLLTAAGVLYSIFKR